MQKKKITAEKNTRSRTAEAGREKALKNPIWENLFVVILALYPLRHIAVGLDLWDTGYNYANFTYMGVEHMDPMWLFSTYLANGAGWLLTKLPQAQTLVGMNFYTGLFVSLLALMGYFFCTRKLGMPGGIVFVGELVAESLCWCPTALLYNYLTYVLFLGAVILLYLGLVREKMGYLAGAGVCLGANVLVRFSNLPEAGLILAVWAYDVILWLEERKAAQKRPLFWSRIWKHTLWCLLGYLGALAVLFFYLHLRYGIGEYVTGIARLFAMTDNAADYTAKAMIMGVVGTYVENLYWVMRMGVILAAGMILFAVAGWLEGKSILQGKSILKGKDSKGSQRDGWNRARVLSVSVRILWVAVSIAMLVWLYARGFCSFSFYSYDPIWRPGPIFLMLAIFMGVIRIFHPESPKEEKLISGIVILVILLTSLGSNNKVLPSLNNLFVAAPYTLWQSWRFLKHVEGQKIGPVTLSAFPAKGLLVAFLALCMVQFGGFGAKFVFAEATGVQDTSGVVENNAILKNVEMDPDKARWMSQISEYVAQNNLQGQEVILYGGIPSLAYYLKMPPAFNSWCDLASYSLEAMRADLEDLEAEMDRPVIILENLYGLEEEGAVDELQDLVSRMALRTEDRWELIRDISENPAAAGYGLKKSLAVKADEKWGLIREFMEKYGYRQTFRNEKFAVYEAE